MKDHIVIQGDRNSGKTTFANKFAALLYADQEILRFGFSKLTYSYIISRDYKIKIVDECPDANTILALASYSDGWKAGTDEEYIVVYVTQADCSALPESRFRIIQCSYSASREEYIVEPLTT